MVHCDMEHKATCVLPQPSMTEEFNWVGRSSGLVWLGEDIKPNFEVCIGDGSYVILYCSNSSSLHHTTTACHETREKLVQIRKRFYRRRGFEPASRLGKLLLHQSAKEVPFLQG